MLVYALGQGMLIPSAWGEVTLTISSLRGGSTIDLGELSESRRRDHEEVTINISATPAAQYRLESVLSSPLVNERGQTLPPSAVHLQITGNTTGRVRFSSHAPLSNGSMELFVSDASGTAETLTVIYGVIVEQLPPAGTYTGAITYTAQAIDGSGIATETIPVRLMVNPVVGFDIAPDSWDRVELGSLEPGQASEAKRLSIVIDTNLVGAYQLVQSVEAPLVNERGESLELSTVRVSVVSGGSIRTEGALEPRMVLLQTDRNADTHTRIELWYSVTVPESQLAGWYRGTLQLMLHGAAGAAGANARSLRCPIELEVLPVMVFSMESVDGGPLELAFSHLTPGMTSDPKTLNLEVRSNIGKAYGLIQEFPSLLISDAGYQFPEEAFVFRAEGASHGQLRPSDWTPVSVGKTHLYRSDQRGSPDEFLVSYQVRVPSDIASGLYRSRLLFTLTEF